VWYTLRRGVSAGLITYDLPFTSNGVFGEGPNMRQVDLKSVPNSVRQPEFGKSPSRENRV